MVRPLAERLRKDGVKVWFDEWEIKPGDSIPAKIEEGLEQSRVLVLCMSANAFGSDWAQLESGTFRFRDPLNRERRFIPLRLDDTPIKGSLAQFLYIDFRFNWTKAIDDLLIACRNSDVTFNPLFRLPDWLSIPDRQWKGNPGALLRADLAIVPFHGREEELQAWTEWAFREDDDVARLMTGPGGMGKTRLAREICLALGKRGIPAGFLDLEEAQQCLAELKLGKRERMLIVVDYAESAVEKVADLLRVIAKENLTGVRVLLLARGAGFWWSQLKRRGDGVGDCLRQEPGRLKPLALDLAARRQSYRIAADAFAAKLGVTSQPQEPADITIVEYERTLLLHMSALLGIQGIQVSGMDAILEAILGREIEYCARQLKEQGLSQLERGLNLAMSAISACGGIQNRRAAVILIQELQYFHDQPMAVVETVADVLHNCYPGTAWIEPVQPDLLMEYMVEKATQEYPELASLILPYWNSKS